MMSSAPQSQHLRRAREAGSKPGLGSRSPGVHPGAVRAVGVAMPVSEGMLVPAGSVPLPAGRPWAGRREAWGGAVHAAGPSPQTGARGHVQHKPSPRNFFPVPDSHKN